MRKVEDMPAPAIDTAAVESFLHRVAIGGAGLRLRDEDRKKARELVGLLPEIVRALGRRRAPLLVDAAAGSGWVSLATLALARPDARALAIERDAKKAERARALAAAATLPSLEVREADLADASAWPSEPDLVVALHACGAASDLAIAHAARVDARAVLVVPCCVASALPMASLAVRKADALGLPRAAPVRRRFVESFVLGARLLTLESLGFETEAVSFVGESVTPYNVVLRGRRGRDAARMRRAATELSILTDS